MGEMKNGRSRHASNSQSNAFQWLLGIGAFAVFVLIMFVILHVLADVNYGNFQGTGGIIVDFLISVFVAIVTAATIWIVSFFVGMAKTNLNRPKTPPDDPIPLGIPRGSYTENWEQPSLPPGPIIDSDPPRK